MCHFVIMQLNKTVSGPRHPGVIGDRGSGSFSRESKLLFSSFGVIISILSVFPCNFIADDCRCTWFIPYFQISLPLFA